MSKVLTDKIKAAAKVYRQGGWNVIPLKNYQKNPASANKSWKHLQSAMATDEEFDRMFGQINITGLGVITGKVSNLYVLDEDSYKGDGKLVRRKSPLIAKSGNDGRHYFFQFDDNMAQMGYREGVNIEGKGEGGFLVLTPSVVLKKDEKTKGNYEWVRKCKITDLPKITEADVAEFKMPSTGASLPFDELMEVPEGSRHMSLRSLIIKKLNETYAHKEDWDKYVWNEIQMHNHNYQPPLPSSQVKRLFEDAKDFVGKNPPWKKDNIKTEDIVVGKPRNLKDLAKERAVEIELEKDAAKTGFKELDFAIKGFVPKHLYTLTGETNIGKTAVCANFAVRVAQQGKNVLYVALEPDNMIIDYMTSVTFEKDYSAITQQDRVDMAEQDGRISIYGVEDIPTPAHLIKAIETENQYQLIIIDHIGYFIQEQQHVYQEQSQVIKKLAMLAKDKLTPIVIVAHINKEASKRGKRLTFNDISGSAAFKQDSTDVWIIERDKEESSKEKGVFRYKSTGSINVAKSKTGANAIVPINFHQGKALITDGIVVEDLF